MPRARKAQHGGKREGAGRPAADPDDKATIRKTWNARPSDLDRLERLRERLGIDSDGGVIRELLERADSEHD